MKMSKQEVRDEHKQTEGDPHVKARLRQLRMERARTRMMAEVPKATVVITNPTHYAIALKYDMEQMAAPRVVAKGVDAVALRIREIANENEVPMVENRPLARALYDNAELDEEIPEDYYKAVAEVISYVFKMNQTYVPMN
jgi:flagellar biosynthetic protein FlhB